jgi:vacuolar protein-sorting-associated protein 4
MFKLHLGNTAHRLSKPDLKHFASKSEGYFNADIDIVVRDVLMRLVRKFQMATHFKHISGPSPTDPNVTCNDLLTPCSPGDSGIMKMTWVDVPGDKLYEPPVTMSDILCSLATSKPAVNDEDMVESPFSLFILYASAAHFPFPFGFYGLSFLINYYYYI